MPRILMILLSLMPILFSGMSSALALKFPPKPLWAQVEPSPRSPFQTGQVPARSVSTTTVPSSDHILTGPIRLRGSGTMERPTPR